jgi:hypothetical protein
MNRRVGEIRCGGIGVEYEPKPTTFADVKYRVLATDRVETAAYCLVKYDPVDLDVT